jgi:hypothetical protein
VKTGKVVADAVVAVEEEVALVVGEAVEEVEAVEVEVAHRVVGEVKHQVDTTPEITLVEEDSIQRIT